VTEAVFAIPGDLNLPTGGYAYDRHVLARLAGQGVEARHLELPGSFPAPSAGDLAATERLIAAADARAVLLVDGLAYGAMPADLVARIRQPIVALVHHPLCLEAGLDAARQAHLRDTERAALGLARAVIATSPTTARTLIADFAVPGRKLTVAEPGTEPAPRATGTGKPLAILSVGSIVPRKAYDVLVRALSPLAGLDWRLTIAGADDRSPEALAALTSAIADTGLGARVTLTGAATQSQLDALYAAADLFVLPSLFEGYGMVLAEAMARGLPIVCTTGGAAAETAPADAALKVPPGDAAALGAAIGHVLRDAAARRAMGAASWAAGRALPRWDDTARIIAAVLRKAGP
jgi:glycosyltransferase involved in cell wall biosynthesis